MNISNSQDSNKLERWFALTPPFNFAELKGFPQKDVISDIFMKIGKEDDKKQLISILKHVLIVKLS